MLEDSDVIYDFDDLFDSKLFTDQLPQFDEDMVLKFLGENENELPMESPEPPLKKKRGPHPKALTREQFYKMRPKMPRISKSDPRRLLATKFAEAYNSCDFDTIWEFVSSHSTKDVVFVHKWVGEETYTNFPPHLEIRGVENVAEYWFSRCVIVPDLVVELKDTKLYVRSDGLSTVLSSFHINCTRLYDGHVSDSLICKPVDGAENGETKSVDEFDSASSEDSVPDLINDRVLEKLDIILLNCTPPPRRRKRSLENADSTSVDGLTNGKVSERKIIPSGTAITLLGTITLQLNQDQKIKQFELTFALKN